MKTTHYRLLDKIVRETVQEKPETREEFLRAVAGKAAEQGVSVTEEELLELLDRSAREDLEHAGEAAAEELPDDELDEIGGGEDWCWKNHSCFYVYKHDRSTHDQACFNDWLCVYSYHDTCDKNDHCQSNYNRGSSHMIT